MTPLNNSNTALQPAEKVIDFEAIYKKNKRYWWLFALCVAGCLAMAVLYLYVKKPVYRIQASVLVAQDDDSSGGASLLKSLSLGSIGSKVDDEVLIMDSREVSTEMIRRLGINRTYIEKKGFLKTVDHYGTSPLAVDAPQALFDTLMVAMKFNVEVDKDGKADITVKKGRFKTLASLEGVALPASVKTVYGTFVVRPTKHYKAGEPLEMKIVVMGDQVKSESLDDDLDAYIISKKSNGIMIDVEDNNIERGKDMLNTMIDIYNERGQQEKDAMAVNTAKFIEDRLGLIYTELTKSEADIENYKRSHNMVDAGLRTKELAEKRSAAEMSAIQLETNYRIMSMVKEFLESPSNKSQMIPFSISSEDDKASSSAINSYNELVLERMKVANSAKEGSEVLAMMDEQIDKMRSNVISSVNNQMAALRVQINRAKQVEGQSQGEISTLPTGEREMRDLYRQQGIQNTLYTFLLQKREENSLLLAATTPKGKIVDHAYSFSEPVSPKKPLILLGALLAGLLIPVLILWVKNLFNTKFASKEELEEITIVPVIGHVHHNRHREDLVVREGKTSSIVEMFRFIRGNTQFLMRGSDDKVLLVTSSVSGEGKTFMSANLAASFALLGKRVALVGLDIRRPKQAQMLGLKKTPGVTAYLSQQSVTLDDIIQPCKEVAGLDVLVGGVVPPNPSELLQGDRIKQLIAELRSRYDVVVLDTAPTAMVSDTFSLAPLADATIYVTRANYTQRGIIKQHLNRIAEAGQLPNIAAVLNDTKPTDDNSYGYGYGYGKDEDGD